MIRSSLQTAPQSEVGHQDATARDYPCSEGSLFWIPEIPPRVCSWYIPFFLAQFLFALTVFGILRISIFRIFSTNNQSISNNSLRSFRFLFSYEILMMTQRDGKTVAVIFTRVRSALLLLRNLRYIDLSLTEYPAIDDDEEGSTSHAISFG